MMRQRLDRFMNCVSSDLCAIVSNVTDEIQNTLEYNVTLVDGHIMIIPSYILVRCMNFAEENGLHFSLLVYQDNLKDLSAQNLRFCFCESENYNHSEPLNPITENDHE